MAIAFARSSAFSGTGATPLTASIVINLGETVVVGVTFNPTTCAVTGVTDNAAGGSSTYTKRGEFVQSTSVKHELWSTSAGGGKVATTVSVAFSGTNTDSGLVAAAYTGVLGIGTYNSGGGASGTHTRSITTQDANNWVVAHFADLDNVTIPTAGIGNLRQTDADVSITQALVDNTAASASSVTCSLGAPTGTPWASGALELRSVSPGTVVTPGLGVLAGAGLAATVAVTLNKFIAIGAAVLQLAGFSPVVDPGIKTNDVLLGTSYAPTTNDVVLLDNRSSGFADTGPIVVLPGTGQAIVTGCAPSIPAQAIALPGTGQLTVTGLAPSASVGVRIPIGLGALTVTGNAPTAGVSNNIAVPIGLGALTATGQAPTVLTPKNVPIGLGALSLTGLAPTASVSNNQNIAIGLGAVTATGQAPTILTPRNVVAGLGAVTATGFNPTPNIGVNLSLGTGVITALGLAPTASVTNNKQVLPGLGAPVVAGLAPTVVTSDKKIALPGTASATATGLAPTVSLPQKALPGLGQLSATGFAPQAQIGTGLQIRPFTGQVIATGFAPTLKAFTFTITGGSVMTGSVTGGGVLIASITGGRTFESGITGGPV